MAEQNTIIQLSEKFNKHSVANSSAYNGDWSSNVENITLYKGDVLQMRSCFIDTVVQNSNLIDVEPDDDTVDYMTLTTTHGYYLCDWGSTPTDIVAAIPEVPAGTDPVTPAVPGVPEIPPGIPANNRNFIPPANGSGQANANERTGNGHQYINCTKKTISPTIPIYELQGIDIALIDNKVDSGDGKYRRGFFKYRAPGSGENEWTKVALEFKKAGNLDGKGKKYGKTNYAKITIDNQSTYLKDGTNFLPILMIGESGFYTDITVTPNGASGTGGTTNAEVLQNLDKMKTKDHLNPNIFVHTDLVTAAGGIYTPNTYRQEFRIPAKKYQPEELAIKLSTVLSSINKGFGSNHVTSSNTFSDNNFITTTLNLSQNNVTVSGGASPPATDFATYCNFAKDTGEEVVYKAIGDAPAVPRITGTGHQTQVNEFIGTSTVDITFDNNVFQFLQIHNSILDNNNNNVTISCVDANSDGKIFRTVANKSTGIYFTNLQPADFWFNKMKLDPGILSKTKITKNTITVGTTDYYVPITPLIDGQHITGDIVGLGSTMRQPSESFFDWEDAPLPTDKNINIESQTIPILGNPVFNNNEVQESGYYQIEVDAGINHSHIKGQQEQNNKIKAIISKFYDQNAYTSAYTEGSITYEHTSEIPIELSQFRVRILNSKGELASQYEELGNDNTVFMEIVRGTNQSN